jgi:hypothetical protein
MVSKFDVNDTASRILETEDSFQRLRNENSIHEIKSFVATVMTTEQIKEGHFEEHLRHHTGLDPPQGRHDPRGHCLYA